VASVHNLPHTGLVGVLLAAKMAGRIPSMKDCLDRLADTGFRLSKSLRIQILRSVQETENQ
jgi:predicted nucleic acid-binding protein